MRTIVKCAALILGGLVALPFALLAILEEHTTNLAVIFHFGAQLMALIPGLPGNFVRSAYYILTLKSYHYTAMTCFGSYFSSREATVGARTGLGSFCVIGRANIGSGVRLASRVSIVSGLHSHGSTATPADIEITDPTSVSIGDDSWLGEGAVVGADIGDRAVVAAGAVILKPVPSDTLAMGNPARILPQTRPKSSPGINQDSSGNRS